MSQPIRGPTPWAEIHPSTCKGMFPARIKHALHLFEWTWHNVDLSYFIAAHMVHSSKCRVQLISYLVPLKILFLHE